MASTMRFTSMPSIWRWKQRQIQGRPAYWLLLNLKLLREDIRDTVRNNACGQLNHSTFWQFVD
jgi:hypothetical protein